MGEGQGGGGLGDYFTASLLGGVRIKGKISPAVKSYRRLNKKSFSDIQGFAIHKLFNPFLQLLG